MEKACEWGTRLGEYRTVRTGYIIMVANDLANKHNVEIVSFGEDPWKIEGVFIKTKAKKKDYKAFAKELIEKLGDNLETFKI